MKSWHFFGMVGPEGRYYSCNNIHLSMANLQKCTLENKG
jgi:hypothetical protein